MALKALVILGVISVASVSQGQVQCNVPASLKEEIHGYQPIVDGIIAAIYGGSYGGRLYSDLADYVDTFGARFAGTQNLEDAIDDVILRQQKAGLTTSTQDVMVPRWVRGEESAEIITPRLQKLKILGLGAAAGTPPEGITAQVVVVKDFDELQERKSQVPGNIVLFNAPYTIYGETGIYRGRGPYEASKLGAAAALVRSITPFSIDSPHTGLTQFVDDVPPIPAAAITLEAADLIQRFVNRGQNVTVTLKMSATTLPDAVSRNVFGDLTGSSLPDEYVVISGHIDTWDVGQGAMDDGGGAFLAWHSLALIKELGLPVPKRTLRAIMWTAEEPGLVGSLAYLNEREDDARKWIAAFESDVGVFETIGIDFDGNDEAACILQEIISLLGAVNATTIERHAGVGSDLVIFRDLGVPIGEPLMLPNKYFWFHHSEGDYMDVLRTEDLDQNLAIFASTLYILADLSIPLPKRNGTDLP